MKKEELSKTFCSLPWVHISNNTWGVYRLCCYSPFSGTNFIIPADLEKSKDDPATDLFRFGYDKIETVWNSSHMKKIRMQMINGDKLSECEFCYKKEQEHTQSKRIMENRTWINDELLTEIEYSKNNNGETKLMPRYFDLRLGNLCNLKCRMCAPSSSSQLYSELVQLQSKINANTDTKVTSLKKIDDWYLRDEFWQDLERYLPYVERIYFAGGEPTLIDAHYELLEKIVNLNLSSNITLAYATNVTNISNRFLGLIDKFKNVQVHCSIDAFGSRNEYMRYPSKWSIISKNFEKLLRTDKKIEISIIPAIQSINLPYLYELYNWLIDLNKKYKKRISIHAHNILFLPKNMSIDLLSKEIKQKIKNQLEVEILEKLNASNQKSLNSLLQYLDNSIIPANVNYLKNEFLKKNEIIDEHRGTYLFDYFPGLKDEFNKG